MLLTAVVLCSLSSYGQYHFSGQVRDPLTEHRVYLSVVEDFRKISSIYEEQILQQIQPDSTGYFQFTGNNLPLENRIYRIHVDTCPENEESFNHFMGHCPNSRDIAFLANNNDTIAFPMGFDEEIFCRVVSQNDKARTLLKVDSLLHDMQFAFATYRSEANRKFNTEKWFGTLQDYGQQLNEPLAELYIFNFLSDKQSFLHNAYLEDLKENPYYDELLERLQQNYPQAPYTPQYEAELAADRFLINRKKSLPWWVYFIGAFGALSILGNFYLIGQWRKYQKKSPKGPSLSKQEENVLDLILKDYTNKEIADALFISVSTVKTHINHIYKKYNVTSREELKSLKDKG